MAAGDEKRIVVIKDIHSNFIEEAIFILRSEPKGQEDFIFKEAQAIINRYIKENGLTVTGGKGRLKTKKVFPIVISANCLINILLVSSFVFLMLLLAQLILL